MLNKTNERKYEIFKKCAESGDIEFGQTYHGVIFGDLINDELADAEIYCYGKFVDGNSEQVLCATPDRSRIFSLADGWCEEDGKLYAVRYGFCYRFEFEVTDEKLEKIANTPTKNNGMYARMRREQMRRNLQKVLPMLLK